MGPKPGASPTAAQTRPQPRTASAPAGLPPVRTRGRYLRGRGRGARPAAAGNTGKTRSWPATRARPAALLAAARPVRPVRPGLGPAPSRQAPPPAGHVVPPRASCARASTTTLLRVRRVPEYTHRLPRQQVRAAWLPVSHQPLGFHMKGLTGSFIVSFKSHSLFSLLCTRGGGLPYQLAKPKAILDRNFYIPDLLMPHRHGSLLLALLLLLLPSPRSQMESTLTP